MLALALLPVAGCGSSSSNGWQTVSTRKASGTALGAIAATVVNPTAIEVKVEAKPNVATQVSYSIDCAKGRHTVTGVTSGRTPFTAPIPLPSSNAASCSVNGTASKSKSAEMTVTVLARSAG
jgi:hypothetical protein